MPCATWIALITWVDLGRIGLTWVDLVRLGCLEMSRVTSGVLGDLGHLGCLTPIATSLQCLPSALRREDNQCPPSALCKEDNRSVLYKRQSVA